LKLSEKLKKNVRLMLLPTILLTFANDQDNYLPLLKKESEQIYDTLAALEDSGQIKVHREESATSDLVLNAFERFDGQICIFHYGGHAGGQQLDLEGGAGQALGLAHLLGRQATQQLQIVFLNGCSTKEQVDRLLKLGVKVIIATSVAIKDKKAVEFAYRFYRKLANNGSIRQAFDNACDGLLLKYEGFPRPEFFPREIVQSRGPIKGKPNKNKLSWGLYFNKDHPEVLDWKIPPVRQTFQRPDPEGAFEVNDYLYSILEKMAEYHPKIAQDIEELEDEREYLDLIIRNFPWNIGSQVKILVSTDSTMNRPQLARIKQIVSTYTATTQFLYYTVLAQVAGKKEESNYALVKENLQRLFMIGQDDLLTLDYLREFQDIMAKLIKKGIEPFVAEFKIIHDELKKGSELYDVYLYLQSIKEQLARGQTEGIEENIHSECADSEYALSFLLRELAFIVNYQMVIVRDISISNPWHRDPLFRHQMGRLYSSADDQLRLFKKPRTYHDFLENSSILLLKNLDEIGSFLSLSPFYIDRNAFGNQEATATDLHAFSYVVSTPDTNRKDYFYIKSSHNIFNALEKRLDQIHTGMEVKEGVRRTRFKGRLMGQRASKDLSPYKPYSLLEEQFENLQSDIRN
jgi:hypothetical protein